MEKGLQRLMGEADEEVKAVLKIRPAPTDGMHDPKTGFEAKLKSIGAWYRRQVDLMRQTTLKEIDNTYSLEREFGVPDYPNKSDTIEVTTGVGTNTVKVSVNYSPIPRKRFMGFEYGDRKSRIQATLTYGGYNIEELMPLMVTVPKKKHGVYDERTQIKNEERIAFYTSVAVQQAVSKSGLLAADNEVGADLKESFEWEVVNGVSRLVKNNNIMKAYQKEAAKKEGNIRLDQLAEKGESAHQQLTDRLAALDREIDAAHVNLLPSLTQYAEEQKARLSESAAQYSERIVEYEQARRKELETLLKEEVARENAGLVSELEGLRKERDQIYGLLEARKTNFRERVPVIEASLRNIFEDYNCHDTRRKNESITPALRANYAAQLAEVLSRQGVYSYDIAIGLVRLIANNVKRSAGQKFTHSDMMGIIGEVSYILDRVHPDNIVNVKNHINAAQFQKYLTVAEMHSFLEPLFKQ